MWIYIYMLCTFHSQIMDLFLYLTPFAYPPAYLPTLHHHPEAKTLSSLPSLSSSTTTNLDFNPLSLVRHGRYTRQGNHDATSCSLMSSISHTFKAVLSIKKTKGEMNTPDMKTWTQWRCGWIF